ncbi:hypothetical protein D7D52_35820 [Nocardia yunnanensis]|uniref:Uncharacterized protein n=1 Tax=Nocardia yunnanensis TaxID=2382165 RepID=A0A386ZLK1_9NOCA|nr:hypothetical protein [Nocardia yunnanensis]AYF78308.1 hypothetical protein D7D52_35820 [Nocardia yunnanensis]
MSTPTLIPTDIRGVSRIGKTSATAFVLVNTPMWGIQLPNGSLWQAYELPPDDPWAKQPTVWAAEADAAAEARGLADKLEARYGIPKTWPTELQVVRLEMDTDGVWKRPEVCSADLGYRPMNLDTEELSAWMCGSTATLTTDEARQVMRDHKECAGQITCKIRGRARATLVRAGVMKLNKNPNIWQSLDLPDMAR